MSRIIPVVFMQSSCVLTAREKKYRFLLEQLHYLPLGLLDNFSPRQTQSACLGLPRPSLTVCTVEQVHADVIIKFPLIVRFPITIEIEAPPRLRPVSHVSRAQVSTYRGQASYTGFPMTSPINVRLFTVLYFSVRSSRWSALRYGCHLV